MTKGFTVTHVEDTRPVKQIRVTNPKGYLDLIINKNKKGSALRISNKFGTSRVYIGVSEVDNLIEALKVAKARAVASSVEAVAFDAETTTSRSTRRASL